MSAAADDVRVQEARRRLAAIPHDTELIHLGQADLVAWVARMHGAAQLLDAYVRDAAGTAPPSSALAAIRGVLDGFDWERDDRQYALEKIKQLATASRIASGLEPGGSATLLPADVARVLGALADAERYRRAWVAAWCDACETSAAGACSDHLDDLDAADAYAALGRQLGQEEDR